LLLSKIPLRKICPLSSDAIMSSSLQSGADDPVLTTAAAARLLGVAVSTTQLWLESGALPSWKTPGGHRRVRLSAVMQLLAAKADRAAPSPPPPPAPADPEF
jgi:excisionase family DNA binding protein